ncbi:glycine-rich domain-containing protein [Psychrobacter pygoscelis]|uniref:glycine-rich domain-containing protein n=1 Tax=Psychrobacter pygoscelis TaxID=2488563 RepID=UPI001040BA68|nr:hypothetical protein [Psychrobacter pygoscelis]
MAVDLTYPKHKRSTTLGQLSSLSAQPQVRLMSQRVRNLEEFTDLGKLSLGRIIPYLLGGIYLVFMFAGNVWLIAILLLVIVTVSTLIIKHKKSYKQKLDFILSTPFPHKLWQSQNLKRLNLSVSERAMVNEGLRDFFLLHALKPKKPLCMPSKYVDELWHAFILDTRSYQEYCQAAFGKPLHHIPDYAFLDRQRNVRMYTYQATCQLHGINPAYPGDRVPRLFGIDSVIGRSLSGLAPPLTLWALLQELSQSYQAWYQTIIGERPDGMDLDFEVDITQDGAATCGSSDSSGGDGGSSCSSCGGD